MFTRLTATVTISAPDASCAFTMTDGELYLPVPTMRRELKLFWAMTNVFMFVPGDVTPGCALFSASPAADEVDHFNVIAVANERLGERRALEDRQIVLHGDAPRIDLEASEQFRHCKRPCQFDGIAVERNLQTITDSNV